jgi:hypothetical protein
MDKSDADKASLLFFVARRLFGQKAPINRSWEKAFFMSSFSGRKCRKCTLKTHDSKTGRTAIVYW